MRLYGYVSVPVYVDVCVYVHVHVYVYVYVQVYVCVYIYIYTHTYGPYIPAYSSTRSRCGERIYAYKLDVGADVIEYVGPFQMSSRPSRPSFGVSETVWPEIAVVSVLSFRWNTMCWDSLQKLLLTFR